MKQISPVVEYNYGNNSHILRRYSEHPIDPITGVVDISKFRGRVINLFYTGELETYDCYDDNGKLTGISCKFVNTNEHGHQLVHLQSHGADATKYEMFVNGNIMKHRHGDVTEQYSNAGYISERRETVDGVTVVSRYKAGSIRNATVRKENQQGGFDIQYNTQNNMTTCGYFKQRTGWPTELDVCSHGKSGIQVHFYKRKHYVISFMDGEKNVTNEVIQMCADPSNITPAEEAFIQLRFGPNFCVTLPEIAKYDIKPVRNAKHSIFVELPRKDGTTAYQRVHHVG